MREFLESVLGTYTPVSYTDSYGVTIIPDGLSGIDWTYVLTALLFIVVVYSVFRILGSFLSRM